VFSPVWFQQANVDALGRVTCCYTIQAIEALREPSMNLLHWNRHGPCHVSAFANIWNSDVLQPAKVMSGHRSGTAVAAAAMEAKRAAAQEAGREGAARALAIGTTGRCGECMSCHQQVTISTFGIASFK
jgi:hypothetical protein